MRLIYKNKKGVSEVVVTVIMVGLVLSLGAVVWGITNGLIKKQTGNVESCFGLMEKVTINREYTCFDYLGNGKFRFSISIGDIDVDGVVVGISDTTETGTNYYPYALTNDFQDLRTEGLAPYPSGTQVKLPVRNGGSTYIATEITSAPDLIRIAPVINGKQCDPTDTLSQIENC